MKWLIATILGAALVGIGLATSRPARAASVTEKPAPTNRFTRFDTLFRKHADANGLDWRLLKAIAIRESSLGSQAFNPRDPSVGLMQILCTGWPERCTNRLPAIPEWPPSDPKRLLDDPDFNVSIGAQILASNVRAYGLPRAIAVYNAFDQRKRPVNGPFKNQRYVDRVLQEFRRLGGEL